MKNDKVDNEKWQGWQWKTMLYNDNIQGRNYCKSMGGMVMLMYYYCEDMVCLCWSVLFFPRLLSDQHSGTFPPFLSAAVVFVLSVIPKIMQYLKYLDEI